jgi:hypothetical protein
LAAVDAFAIRACVDPLQRGVDHSQLIDVAFDLGEIGVDDQGRERVVMEISGALGHVARILDERLGARAFDLLAQLLCAFA